MLLTGKTYLVLKSINFLINDSILSSEQTFWMTTGLYPQSLVISFPQTVEVKSVKITGHGSNT
jgi:hypothetical protein